MPDPSAESPDPRLTSPDVSAMEDAGRDGAAGRSRPPRAVAWLGVVLLAGTACRVALSLHPGHASDVDLFISWMRALTEHGLGGFYDHSGANYPPIYILTLRALGAAVSELKPWASGDVFLRACQRIPACLADVLLAILLFTEVRRIYGARAGLAAATLYFLNPVTLYVSAYWGQVDSIHTLFIIAALAAVRRVRPAWCGCAAALAVLQKLQSVAFLPILIFDVYRWRRWGGLGRFVFGAACAFALVMSPFLLTGSATAALSRGYGVIGQYPRLSINAFNAWRIGDRHEQADTVPPVPLIRAAAGGEPSVDARATWYLALNWRRIGSLVFILMTATILSLYARSAAPDTRALAAAALGLAFFLFLTEMHERYAFPVVALLAIWAVRSSWRERAYVFLSVLLLLNLTDPQPVGQIASDLGAAGVLLFVGLCGALALGAVHERGPRTETRAEAAPDAPPPAPSRLVSAFRVATLLAWVACLGTGGMLIRIAAGAPEVATAGATYLSDLAPATVRQGYGRLTRDADVEGSPLMLGDRFYLKGLGTHAPATITYEIPRGAVRFEAVVGVQRGFNGRVTVRVDLGGKTVVSSDALTSTSEPLVVSMPVRRARRLTLRMDPDGANNGDHVTWGMARFTRQDP